jgi:hypothetical protein
MTARAGATADQFDRAAELGPLPGDIAAGLERLAARRSAVAGGCRAMGRSRCDRAALHAAVASRSSRQWVVAILLYEVHALSHGRLDAMGAVIAWALSRT